jgi:hypothetical protein
VPLFFLGPCPRAGLTGEEPISMASAQYSHNRFYPEQFAELSAISENVKLFSEIAENSLTA